MKDKIIVWPRFRIAGDLGLLVEYGDTIDPEVNRKVRAMTTVLEQHRPEGVVEVVPTYRSLLIIYDPAATRPDRLRRDLQELTRRREKIQIPTPATVEIPVCYGGKYGPDLGHVANIHKLTSAEVVALHSAPVYPIYMVGFTPGFPFLGGLPEALHTPRLQTPRTLVPAGSVGIANAQTGIYPVASPGGWQIIGQTPVKLFDPNRSEPFLYKAGDRIRFRPISREEFETARQKG